MSVIAAGDVGCFHVRSLHAYTFTFLANSAFHCEIDKILPENGGSFVSRTFSNRRNHKKFGFHERCVMGAEPYWYFEKFNGDVDATLQALRQREFKAGRYNPVIAFPFQLFPIGPDSPAPGAKHSSIEEAMEYSSADGTRSILDLDHVAEVPDVCAVAPVPDEVL